MWSEVVTSAALLFMGGPLSYIGWLLLYRIRMGKWPLSGAEVELELRNNELNRIGSYYRGVINTTEAELARERTRLAAREDMLLQTMARMMNNETRV